MYSIDLNINHESLVLLNQTIETGLENFTLAAGRLDLVSKQIKDNAGYEKELALIRKSLTDLAANLTTSTTKGLQTFTTGLNDLSVKVVALAGKLQAVDPAEVNGAIASIKSSLTLIKTSLAKSVEGLDIKLEGVTVGKITLAEGKGSVESVDIKLVKIPQFIGEENTIKKLEIDLVKVAKATGEVKKVTVEEVNVKTETTKSKASTTTTTTSSSPVSNINLAKATPSVNPQPIVAKTVTIDNVQLLSQLNAAGQAIADSLNQINKELLSKSSAIPDAIGDLLADLRPVGRISAVDILSEISFETVDLSAIITAKIDSANLGEILTAKSAGAKSKEFKPETVSETIQNTGLEDHINEFARFISDASNSLDQHSKEFNTSAARLVTVAKRFTKIADSTQGFEGLAQQIKGQTAQLGEALAGLVLTVNQAKYATPKPQERVVATPAETAQIFTNEGNKATASRNDVLAASLGEMGTLAKLRAQASVDQGKPISLNELNKDGKYSEKLQSIVSGLIAGIPKAEKTGGYHDRAVFTVDELREFARNALVAIRNDSRVPRADVDKLEKDAQEVVGNKLKVKNSENLENGGYLAGRQVPDGQPVNHLNPDKITQITPTGLNTSIELNAFDRAKKAIDSGADQLDEGLRISLAGLFGYATEAVQNTKKAAAKSLKEAADKANASKKERADKQREIDLAEQADKEAVQAAVDERNARSAAGKETKTAARRTRQSNAIAKLQEGTTVPLPPESPANPPAPPQQPSTPPAPPQPPSNPPRDSSNPSEDNSELTYAQQLRMAKNDFTQSPSLETIAKFPDPSKFVWEDQRNLTVALSDVDATRHKNLLTLLSKLKTLETRALSRGESGESDAMKISQEIYTVSKELGKAGENLGVESDSRVDKKLDSNAATKEKKLAKELIEQLQTDVAKGAKHSNLLETIKNNSEELGAELKSVEEALDKQIKARLGGLIKTQIDSVRSQMADGHMFTEAGFKLDEKDATDVRHVNGSGYGKKYQDYASGKLVTGFDKAKRETISKNKEQAELANLEGKDYSQNIGNISFVDPVAGKALSDKIEAAKIANDSKTIKEKKEELNQLLKAGQFGLAKRALDSLKNNSEISQIEYSNGIKDLSDKQIAYYRKAYHIAKNAGQTTKQTEALLEIEKINPDIATGLKAKESSGDSLASKVNRANEIIKLGGREEELAKLLEEIKAIDQLKRDALDSAILAKKRKQIRRDIRGDVNRGDGLNQDYLSQLDAQTREEIVQSTKSTRINQKKLPLEDLIRKLPTDLSQLPAIKKLLEEIKVIDNELAKPIELKSNKNIVAALYQQLVASLDSNNLSLQAEIESLIVTFDSSAVGKAKAQSTSNKLKPLLVQLQTAKQNLDTGLITSTLADIKILSSAAFTAVDAGSRTSKIKSLNRDIDKALLERNTTTQNSLVATLTALDPVEGSKTGKRVTSVNNQIGFQYANDEFNRLKQAVSDFGVEKYRGQEVTKSEIFGGNEIKGNSENLQANQLVLSVNNWLKKQIKTFDDQQLTAAKDLAKLGDFSKLKELKARGEKDTNGNINPLSNQDKVSLAYKSLADTEERQIQGLSSTQKAVRERLNAQMLAAITDTSKGREKFIKQAIEDIELYRKNNAKASDKSKSNQAAGLPFDKVDDIVKGGLMDNVLKAINNRGEKGLKQGQVGENPFKLQDLAGLYYTLYNLGKNIKDFAKGVIEAATSVSTELIRLGVVNSGNAARTVADAKSAQELSKKYGGSQASYLNSIASFKTADILQYDKFGQSQGQRFGQKEISGLVEGLNAAYSVNQLSKTRRDDANAAITQMFSKGVVNSEEVKRQLSNQIPGATPLFAQALGISSGQFTKRMERNEVADTELFKLGSSFKSLFSEAASQVNLNNEIFKLGGKTEDVLNRGAQPIGAAVLPATMLLNKLFDGLVSNAGAFTVGMAPIALLMSGTLYSGLKKSMVNSQIAGMSGEFLDGVKKNKIGLGSIGLGLGLATLGSSVLGTDGLDKTLSGAANNLPHLLNALTLGVTDSVRAGFEGALKFIGVNNDKNEINPEAKNNPFAKLAFEIAPLAALIFPAINYARGQGLIGAPSTPNIPSRPFSLEGGEINRKPSLIERAKTFGGEIKSSLSSINLADVGLSIVGAVASYAIANTTFITEYKKVTDELIGKLSKIDPANNSEEAGEVRIAELIKAEKAGELTLDLVANVIRDIKNINEKNYSEVSTEAVQKLAKEYDSTPGAHNSEGTILAKQEYELRKKQGRTVTGGYIGEAAQKTADSYEALINKGTATNQDLLNDNNYKAEKDLAKTLRANLAASKAKLIRITKEGLITDEKTGLDRPINDTDYDETATIVKKQEAEYRQKIDRTPKRIGGIVNNIKTLEQGIETIQADPLHDAEFKKPLFTRLKNLINEAKERLPDITKSSAEIDPTQSISGTVTKNEERLVVIGREETANKALANQQSADSAAQRLNEGSDTYKNLRDSSIGLSTAQAEYKSKLEKAQIASENAKVIAGLPENDGQQAKLQKALSDEATALEQLKAATLGLTQAQIAQQQSLEDSLMKQFDRDLKNYGYGGVGTTDYSTRSSEVNEAAKEILQKKPLSVEDAKTVKNKTISSQENSVKGSYIQYGKDKIAIELAPKDAKISEEEYNKNLTNSIQSYLTGGANNAFLGTKATPKYSEKDIQRFKEKDGTDYTSKFKKVSEQVEAAKQVASIEATKSNQQTKNPGSPKYTGNNLSEIASFGTVNQSIYALERFKTLLPQLKLTAEEATDKFRELRTNMILATLSFANQQRQIQADRAVANNLKTPETKEFTTFNDTFTQLQTNKRNSLIGQKQNQLEIADTKKALSFTDISPQERANLAVKLAGLETDAIKRKHEVELAGIEMAKAAYENMNSQLTRKIGEILSGADIKLTGTREKLERELLLKNNQFSRTGGELTNGVKLVNNLETAKKDLTEARNTRADSNKKIIEAGTDSINPATGKPSLPEGSKKALTDTISELSAVELLGFANTLDAALAKYAKDNSTGIPSAEAKGVTFPMENLAEVSAILKQAGVSKQTDAKEVANVTAKQVELDKYKAEKQRELQENNRQIDTSKKELTAQIINNAKTSKDSLVEADAAIDAFIAKRDKTPENNQDKITALNNRFTSDILVSNQSIANAKDTVNKQEQKNKENVIAGLPIDTANSNAEVTKAKLAIDKAQNSQLAIINKAGVELLNTILTLPNNTANLLSTINDKIKETIEQINTYQGIGEKLSVLGVNSIFGQGRLAESVSEVYKSPINGKDQIRQRLATENYDPAVAGDKERAKLELDVLKHNTGIDASLVGLNQLKNSPAVLTNQSEIEKNENFKLQSEEMKSKILRALAEAGGGMPAEKFTELLDGLITDAERLRIVGEKKDLLNNKLKAISDNKLALNTLSNTLDLNQSKQKTLASQSDNSSYETKNRIDDYKVAERRIKRAKLNAEYDQTALGTSDESVLSTARTKRDVGIQEIDDQANKMEEYGGRFVNKIEEAVTSASNLSETFKKAIEGGNWSYVLTDILSGIANNLASSFGKDAQSNLGGMAKGLITGLFGMTPSMSQGSIPSYSTGHLPSYSNGLGTPGSTYPRTPTQDPREPRQSHLAVINKDELVLNADQTSRYLNHQPAANAIANMRPSYTNNNRNSQDTYQTTNYSNYTVQENTFSRNPSLAAVDRDRETKRFS